MSFNGLFCFSTGSLAAKNLLELQLQYNHTQDMVELSFEWDESKSALNQKSTVFSDDVARLIPDPDSEGEERFILMGISSQLRILTVCHCERGLNVIRIISARKADKSEREQYEAYRHA